ncbi:PKD domain-containing protein [Dysgonomonas macrotermitis]|uniref:PKD domain-containing protein n=1 Tax=Dysgonomonas macrotermitis TaxID=1346286 RepID=A0A1M4YU94_9BACT|nr:PKD domain-containing protein [Dysgonomonas macrotermitis]SHF09323.1 hypothetical protein SAMN05444362_103271 [Dysgonomonas macrotermitis]
MKKLIYAGLLFLIVQLNTFAQKETSWWYFGFNAGLNFNSLSSATASDGSTVTDMPESIVGPLSTREGCFTVATYDGRLLFSSDGSTVYDKNGSVMTNGTGLLGNYSSTQSGVAVPKPGSTTEYYVITVPQALDPDGLCYSIVDLSQNGGLGAVTSKNNVIKAGVVYENIAVVPNTNGLDYWLIHRTAQTFYVWAITSSGISTTPHQTISNTSISAASSTYQGEIGISSDYTKVFACNWAGQQVITSIFNPTTGLLSDIRISTMALASYGGTFSPNNQYLYIGSANSVSGTNQSGSLFVQTWNNLRAGSAMTLLRHGVTNAKKAMDGRLYGIESLIGLNYSKHLYVIINPDAGGSTIKYFPNYLKYESGLGLPTFAAGFIRIIPKELPFACTSHNRTYSVEVDLSGGNAPSRLTWNFGDGTAIINQTVTTSQSIYKQLHSYNNSGLYTITVIPYKSDGTSLTPITMEANIVNCTLKSNRMTRSDLLNSKQLME